EDPTRGVYQEASKCQTLLLVVTQFSLPAPRQGQHGNQAPQVEALERIRKCLFGEVLDLQRVGENLAQRAWRQIWLAPHIERLVFLRPRDPSRAPRPQPRERAEQQGLAYSRLSHDENPVASLDLNFRFFQHRAAGWRRDLEVLYGHLVRRTGFERDAAADTVQSIAEQQRVAKVRDAQQSRAPIRDAAEII